MVIPLATHLLLYNRIYRRLLNVRKYYVYFMTNFEGSLDIYLCREYLVELLKSVAFRDELCNY